MNLLVLPGDGIGPEITAATLDVLRAVSERFDLRLQIEEAAVGHAGLRDTDARMGEILDAMDWGGGNTAFLLVADHGMEESDPECKGDPGCRDCSTIRENCTDGIDNNCNGLVDCNDPQCSADPS